MSLSPRCLSALTGVLVAAAAGAAAQVFYSGVEMVMVTVSVTDTSGRLVGGLTREDLRIFEDGRPQTVSAFTADRLPLSLGVLVDASDSMFGARMAAARQALASFLEELSVEDEVFLRTFNHEQQLVSDWAMDPGSLSGRLDRTTPFGSTALYDAVSMAVPAFLTRRHQRAALLVISDGADTASEATLVDTASLLRRADPFVYAIGIDASSHVAISRRVNEGALQTLTDPTGGYTEVVRETSELEAATSRIAAELNAQYTLGYMPDHPPDGKYHVISVRIPGREHTVRARRGYVSTRR